MSATESPTIKVIAFQLHDKEYALPVDQVYSIEKQIHITRVPGTAHFVKGVINLRGVVTPIIDLRTRFGLGASEESDTIIIAALDEVEVGLIVDGANDVLDIPEAAIEPQPEVVGALGDEYITGIAKLDRRLLIMLSLHKIFYDGVKA